MITRINSANANKYSLLFSKATKDLKDKDAEIKAQGGEGFLKIDTITEYDEDGQPIILEVGGEISSLSEYFSYLEELASIDEKYLILPLDEDFFEIDANARTITVPKVFQTNGISIQGDEVSEVVYFKIDRYYDAMDLGLSATGQLGIFVEWTNAAGEKGVSIPNIIDVESQPGYVIFGWPLGTKITHAPGDITFAVRFYKFNEEVNTLEYSLSTLTTKATIKPSLNFTIDEYLVSGQGSGDIISDSNKTLILDRIENSPSDEVGAEAQEPVIIDLPGDEDDATTVYLEVNELGELAPAKVTAAAMSVDGGQLTYNWRKYNYYTNVREIEDTEFNDGIVENVAIPLTYDEAVSLKASSPQVAIYQLVNEHTQSFTLIEDLDALDPKPDTVYVKGSSALLNKIGYYKISVINRVGRSTAKIIGRTIFVFPAATPVIKDFKDKDYLVGDTDSLAVEIEVSHEFPEAPGLEPGCRPGRDNEAGDKSGYTNYPLEGEVTYNTDLYPFDPSKEDITYQWMFRTPNSTQAVDIEQANEKTYIATEEGYYSVKITGSLNGDSKSVTSSECRITEEVKAPTISISALNTDGIKQTITTMSIEDQEATEGEDNVLDMYLEDTVDGVEVTVATKDSNRQDEDTIEYQWYEYYAGAAGITNEAIRVIAPTMMAGTYTPSNQDIKIADANDAHFIPGTAKSAYFCIITNTYNGKTIKTSSPLVRVAE